MGSSALPSFNPCQDIFPLPVNDNDDARGISDSVNVLSEVKEGFVKLMVVDEDWGYGEQFSENEGDDEYIRNLFDIIIGNE